MQNKASEVKSFLTKKIIHDKWSSDYRTSENEIFFELALKYILKKIKPNNQYPFLDVGCGYGTKSILLAKNNQRVVALDYSKNAIEKFKDNIKNDNSQIIKIMQGDITSLNLKNDSFKYILCWGVLMHVVEIEKAISEVSRVLSPGGIVIISENNMHSIFRRIILPLKKLIFSSKSNHQEIINNNGIERWFDIDGDKLIAREANINNLINQFSKNGLSIKECISGQFTEYYTKFKSEKIKKIIHKFNNLWFRHIRYPLLSTGVIIVFQKD